MPLPNNDTTCNAHKRDGSLCTNIPVRGKTKCRMHGGKSLEGMANGNYRTGRYSKHLPTQMAVRAEEARHNPRLLSLEDDIALTESRLAQLMERLETGESGAAWRAIRETFGHLRQALTTGDSLSMHTHFQTMEGLITRGVSGASAWEESLKVLETRCKQTQTQVKTLQALQQMITVQQHQLALGAAMQAFIEAVHEECPDVASGRRILMRVGAEMTRLSLLEERR